LNTELFQQLAAVKYDTEVSYSINGDVVALKSVRCDGLQECDEGSQISSANADFQFIIAEGSV
jgi:hypothetical protein